MWQLCQAPVNDVEQKREKAFGLGMEGLELRTVENRGMALPAEPTRQAHELRLQTSGELYSMTVAVSWRLGLLVAGASLVSN